MSLMAYVPNKLIISVSIISVSVKKLKSFGKNLLDILFETL